MDIKKAGRFLLKDKITWNTSVFYYLAFITIAIISVYPLFNTGLACGDDMASYLVTRLDKVFTNAVLLAEMHGRFQYIITLPIQSIPFAWDNIFVIKLFQVVPILVSLCLFYRVVLILTKSKDLSAFFVMLFFVTAQVSRHTSLFVNYPFFFSFSFSILLLSYLLLHRFQRTKNYWALAGSAMLFALGLLFFEMYILFIVFVFLAVIYNSFTGGNRGLPLVKKVAWQILPFLVVAISYLTVYILYSHAHPTRYEGNKMADTATILNSFFTVLWKLSYTAIPLTVYDATHDLFAKTSEMIGGYHNIVPYLVARARVEWIVKGVLVFGMSWYLLVRMPKIAWRTLLAGALLAAMMTFFPHIPLALTVKYTFYVTTQNMLGYVTTFFSLFGVVLFLTLLTAFLLNFTGTFTLVRHATALVLSAGFVLCSFLTDFSNYYVTRDIDRASTRLYAMDEMVKSDKFKIIPQPSLMYGADLWYNPSTQASGLTVQNFEWSHYVAAKSGISQFIFYNDSAFLSQAKQSQQPCYRIMYNQADKSDDALLAIAQLKQPGANDTRIDSVSEKILVEYYSKYKYFTVTLKVKPVNPLEKNKLKINHIHGEFDPGEYVEFVVYNLKLNDPATIFTIEGPPMIIESIHVSNFINTSLEVFYL